MIHIWLPTQHAALRLWQHTTQTWQTAENWQELATLAGLQTTKSTNLQACVYFPSVSLLKIQPELAMAQLKPLGETGRRYLFEDISIGSVEDLQVKIQPTTSNSELPALFGLHQTDVTAWMHAAALAGIDIVALLPDFLLLPTIDTSESPTTSAVYYQDADTQLLKLNAYHGMAVSFLPLVLRKLPHLETLYLTGVNDDTLAPQLAPISNLTVERSDLLPVPVKDPIRHFFNFATIKRDTTLAPYAKVIVLVIVCALLTAFVVDGLRWYYYDKAQKQAKALLEQQYSLWFPNEKLNSKLNIQRQLAGKLTTQQQTTPSVLTTLSTIQPVLQQYQLTARQINFQNNRLQLQLVASSPDILNKAVADMTNKGVKAKLGAVDGSVTSALPLASNTNPTPTAPTTAVAMIDIDVSN